MRYLIPFRNFLIFFYFLFYCVESNSKVCTPKIIKNYQELQNKINKALGSKKVHKATTPSPEPSKTDTKYMDKHAKIESKGNVKLEKIEKKAEKKKVVRTGPKGVNYKPLNEKIGNTYVISNNMEYAEPICYGTGLPASWKKAGIKGSSQNPPPWVEQIAKSMQRYIEFNWDKIVRETN